MSDVDYSGTHVYATVEWDEDGPVMAACVECDVKKGSRAARETPCPR